MSTRDIVVFLAHYFDAEVERRILKLKREASPLCDVALLVEKGAAVPQALRPLAQTFDFSELRMRARSVIGDRIAPGNCHLRAIDFAERFPGYRHYWFVEYDVVYTGDWGAFLRRFADDPSDLIATHLRKLVDDPHWTWGASFRPGADPCRIDARIVAFQPIHRISARGLAAVKRKVEDGWTGHFEILVPTALAFEGLSLSDFGGTGAWTPPGRVGLNYLEWKRPAVLGTVRCAPPVTQRLIRNMLHHPCKTRHEPREREDEARDERRAARKAMSFAYRFKVLQHAISSRLRPG